MSSEVINKLITELKSSRTDDNRLRIARRLREYVRVESRSGTDLSFDTMMTALYGKIADLVGSSESSDKLCGIYIIYELTDENLPGNETKIAKFANYLRTIPPSTGDTTVLRMSARALGHLARAGGTTTADFVEFEAKRALDWLQVVEPRNEAKKLASVYILREMIDDAPTLFYPNVAVFFAHIWSGLSDPKVTIREASARALASGLSLVASRKSKYREQWYSNLYNTARGALASGGVSASSGGGSSIMGGSSVATRWVDMLHGALITIGELLANAAMFSDNRSNSDASAASVLISRYDEMFEIVLKHRSSKDKLVRRTVIALLPRLAHLHPEQFLRQFAEKALTYLNACLRDSKLLSDRGLCFIALGRISLAIGPHLAGEALSSQLEKIVEAVREGLTSSQTQSSSSKRTKPVVAEAQACLAMLARSIGPSLTDYCHVLLDTLFSDGLSEGLTEALSAIGEAIPSLRALLHERLLHELSVILAGRPFIPTHVDRLSIQFATPTSFGSGSAASMDPHLVQSLMASGQDASSAYGLLPPWGTSSSWARPGSQMSSEAFLTSVLLSTHSGYVFTPTAPSSVGALSSTWSKYLSSSILGFAAGLERDTRDTRDRAMPALSLAVVSARQRRVPSAVLVMALHTLGTFDFRGVSLLPFVREAVVQYLDDPDTACRLEAGLAIARIIARSGESDPALSSEFGRSGVDFDVGGGAAMGMDPRLDPDLGFEGDMDTDFDLDIDPDFPDPTDPFAGDAAAVAAVGVTDGDADPLSPLSLLMKSLRLSSLEQPRSGVLALQKHPLRVLAQSTGSARSRGAGTALDDAPAVSPARLELEYLRSLHGARTRRARAFKRIYDRSTLPSHHPLLSTGSLNHTLGAVGSLSSGAFLSASAAVHAMNSINGGIGDPHSIFNGSSASFGPGASSSPSTVLTVQLLQRLLLLAVSDPDPSVRFEVLQSLGHRFDLLLSDAENVRILAAGLQDENFACREACLSVIGRLAVLNPSVVFPLLRRLLFQLVAELDTPNAYPDVTPPLVGPSRAGAVTGADVTDADAADFTTAQSALFGTGSNSLGASTGTALSTTLGFAMGAGTLPADAVYERYLSNSAFDSAFGLESFAPAHVRIAANTAASTHEALLAAAAGGGGREHAARMLGLLLRAGQRLLHPVAPMLLKVLLPQSFGAGALARAHAVKGLPLVPALPAGYSPFHSHHFPGVHLRAPLSHGPSSGFYASSAQPEILSAAMLGALGELAAVAADALLPHMHVLLPLVVSGIFQSARVLGLGVSLGTDSSLSSFSSELKSSGSMRAITSGSNSGIANNELLSLSMSTSGVLCLVPPAALATHGQATLLLAVAVKTLGLLVECSGSVVVPFLEFPHLLPTLLAVLLRGPTSVTTPAVALGLSNPNSLSTVKDRGHGLSVGMSDGSGWPLRREVLRTIGVIGALDPLRLRLSHIAHAQRSAAAEQAALQARMEAAVAASRQRGALQARAGLTRTELTKGVYPGQVSLQAMYPDYSDAFTPGSGNSDPFNKDDDPLRLGSNGLPLVVNDFFMDSIGISVTQSETSDPSSALFKASVGTSSASSTTATSSNTKRVPTIMDKAADADTPWSITADLPSTKGVALTSTFRVDPMEAALAGLAGEPGSNVGINVDELDLGLVALTLGQGYVIGGDIPGISGRHGNIRHAQQLSDGSGAVTGSVGDRSSGSAADGTNDSIEDLLSIDARKITPSMVGSSEDFAPTVALSALLALLEDETQAHSQTVLGLVMEILYSLETPAKILRYLPGVVKYLLRLLEASLARLQAQASVAPVSVAVSAKGSGSAAAAAVVGSFEAHAFSGRDTPLLLESGSSAGHAGSSTVLRDSLLGHLAALIMVVRQAIRPWLGEIFSLLRRLWPVSLSGILRVVVAASAALGEEVQPYLVGMVPLMLSTLHHDGTLPPIIGGLSTSSFALLEPSLRDFSDIREPSAPESPYGLGFYLSGSVDHPVLTPSPPDGRIPPPQQLPPPYTRPMARLVIQAIVLLVCGERRPLHGGHRRLLDAHLPVLLPAIARLIDSGLSPGNSAAGEMSGDSKAASAPTTGAGGAGEELSWQTTSAVYSNSASLLYYGPICPQTRRLAVDALAVLLAGGVDARALAARLVPPLARVLSAPPSVSPVSLKMAALDCLSLLLLQLREEYLVWVSLVRLALLAGCKLLAEPSVPSGASGLNTSGSGVAGAGFNESFTQADSGLPSEGVSGAGGPLLYHATYERLVALLLGFGSGLGYCADESLYLFGYGPVPSLPSNPVDIAELLYDPGTCGRDGSGPRLASALSLANTTNSSNSTAASQTQGGKENQLKKMGAAAAAAATAVAGDVTGPLGLLGGVTTDTAFVVLPPALIANSALATHPNILSANQAMLITDPLGAPSTSAAAAPAPVRQRPHVSQDTLRRTFDCSARNTQDDWKEWFRRVSMALLSESPSPALRACYPLAQQHAPLSIELFNASFVVLWVSLFNDLQDLILTALEIAFRASNVPVPILQTLLGLAAYMEKDDHPLPIDPRHLGELAERVGALSMALRFRELEFLSAPGEASTVEALILVNNLLDQPDAAVGLFQLVLMEPGANASLGYRESHLLPAIGGAAPPSVLGVLLQPEEAIEQSVSLTGEPLLPTSGSNNNMNTITNTANSVAATLAPAGGIDQWLENLGHWSAALASYEQRQLANPSSLSLVLARLRCMEALREWERLFALAVESWPRLVHSVEGRAAIAPVAARAAWTLGHWDYLAEFLEFTPQDTYDGLFYRAVLCTHRLQFAKAYAYIDSARALLSTEFVSKEGQSYARAYPLVVRAQMLTELEEVLNYLRLAVEGSKQALAYLAHIKSLWTVRLRGAAQSPDACAPIMVLRSLVLSPVDTREAQLKFAAICRRKGHLNAGLRALLALGEQPTSSVDLVSDFKGLSIDGNDEDLSGKYEWVPRTIPDAITSTSLSVPALVEASGATTHIPVHFGFVERFLSSSKAAQVSSSAGGTSARNVPTIVPGLSDRTRAFLMSCYSALKPSTPTKHSSTPGDSAFRPQWPDREVLDSDLVLGAESAAHPRVVYAYCKHLWYSGYELEALAQLRALQALLDSLHKTRKAKIAKAEANGLVEEAALLAQQPGALGKHRMDVPDENALRVQVNLRVGQWSWHLLDPIVHMNVSGGSGNTSQSPSSASTAENSNSGSNATSTVYGLGKNRVASPVFAELISPVLASFATATHDCGERGFNHYRGWHAWALTNFHAAQYFSENLRLGVDASVEEFSSFPTQSAVTSHAVAAVRGFLKAIVLGRRRLKAYILQDLLRLLTLWFHFGDALAVHEAMVNCVRSQSISSDVWLQVTPQLIARLSISFEPRRNLLHSLLCHVGDSHPQALVYPLTVASKSSSSGRRRAASRILRSISSQHLNLVLQAELVSRELIRTAILWLELWHSGLEDASKVFFSDGQPQAMLDVLLPLHEMLVNPGPQTERELAFVQAFGRDLDQAYDWLKQYARQLARGVPKERCAGDAAAAWDIYYQVFRRLNKALPGVTGLMLEQTAPLLLSAHNLQLAMPGTYAAGVPPVSILSFCPQVTVIASKQRPRKVVVRGTDGRSYTYLLKGHEDLRQDERVMQLFGLVNTLLSTDYDTIRSDLGIRRYAVTPLSHNVGLVGWVPYTDTMHALIKDHRESKTVLLNIEHRLMCQVAPSLETLTPLQKVEVFRYALSNTSGHDLAKVLWLKSSSSDVWLERRSNYSRSLGVMSIVGYILGLGDRHPSNLLIDRPSGKVLHIDFGDCFEVAMTREKFPERIPFRLTRMLVAAMESCGIEGTFRTTCVSVARVLRAHRDSVMAMLEAFVHDPLINWRLLTNDADKEKEKEREKEKDKEKESKSSRESNESNPAAAHITVPVDRINVVAVDSSTTQASTAAVPPPVGVPAIGVPPNAPIGSFIPGGVNASAAAANTQEHINVNTGEPATTSTTNVTKMARSVVSSSMRTRELMTAGVASLAPANSAAARSLHAHALQFAAAFEANAGDLPSASVANFNGPNVTSASQAARTLSRSLAKASTVMETEGDADSDKNGSNTAGDEEEGVSEQLNERALSLLKRINSKLIGRDFSDGDPIGVVMSRGISSKQVHTELEGNGLVQLGHLNNTAGGGSISNLLPNTSQTHTIGYTSSFGESDGRNNNNVPNASLDVPSQVQKLILAATSHENLCVCYIGWCPFW